MSRTNDTTIYSSHLNYTLVLGAVAGPGHRHAPKILAVLRRALAPRVLGTAASNASDVSEAGYYYHFSVKS